MPRRGSWWRITLSGLPIANAHLLHSKGRVELLLLREAFRRFAGESSQGVFVLSQAMGGGKTHNMLALGLLAGYPELRESVIENAHQFSSVGRVRVVGFSGRESDAPFGLWGAIAEQ